MRSAASISRRTWLAGSGGAATLAVLGKAHGVDAQGRTAMLRGVNLAGAEFGEQSMPGRFGKDYTYPDAASFARFKSYGFNCIRLPFRWERLQPDLDAAFDEAEWRRLSAAIDAARRNGQTIILDLHNYARRRVRADRFKADHMIGSALAPAEALARLWAQLARSVAGQAHVVLGIMNEPADIEAGRWLDIANLTIAAIRSAGARQLILAPGVDWSGAHSWYTSGNTLMQRLVDPARNLGVEAHQYLDGDSSGRSGRSVSATIGSERLEAFQAWARHHGFKAFLGEFGAGADATSVAALTDMLIEVERNADVWIGWTAWAAGPWWPPDEPLRLEPNAGGVLPAQTRAMMRFTQPGAAPDDVIAESVVDLDFARERYSGVSGLEGVVTVARGDAGRALDRAGGFQSFAAYRPRRTDLGLLIEGATKNVLGGVEPVGVPSAATLARAAAVLANVTAPTFLIGPVGTANRWRPGSQQVAALLGEAAGGYVAFGVHVLADPLKPAVLTLSIGDADAEIDVAKCTARMTSGIGAISISASGVWRRVTLALPSTTLGANPVVTFSKRADPDAEVAVGAAMLGAGTVSATFAEGARAGDEVALDGPLRALFGAPAFTLMIETRGLTSLPVDLPLLYLGSNLLLQRRKDGALASPAVAGAATAPAGPDRWAPRRRSVVVLDRVSGRITLATTGLPPVTATVQWPDSAAGPLLLGSRLGGQGPGNGLALDGFVTRIAVIPRALDAAAAAVLAGQ